MRTNFAYKKDKAHNAVVSAFRHYGWQVCETWRAPDCPDLFAAKQGRVVAVEVKTGNRKLNEGQQAFRDRWEGEYYVVTCVEAVDRINALQVIQDAPGARIGAV